MGLEKSYVTASRLGSPYSVPILIDRYTIYSNIPGPTDGELDSVSISSGQLLVSDFDTVDESPWKYYTKSGSIDRNIPKNIIPSGIIIFDGNSSNVAFHFIGGISADRSFAPLTSFWYDSNMELASIENASYVRFRGAINFSVTLGYGETMEQIATAESFAIVAFKYYSEAARGRYALELWSKNGGIWKRVSGFGAVNAAPIETFDLALTEEPVHQIPPYDPGGSSGPSGGNGLFGNDRVNDDITQLIPPGSAANSLTDAGIFSHYLVNSAQLKDFSRWLFSDNFFEVIHKELIELWFGNTFDAIISLMSYPFAVGQLPMITSKPSNIYLGHFDTDAGTSGLLTSESSQLDWGNIDIREYWGNFLDYAPHTKIQLYLPWGTGFVDIDPNECMNGSLNVKTNIELTKGNCVHIVSNSRGAVIGTYNGFCGAQYPITSKDTSGKAIGAVISAVSAAVAIGSAAVTGGASIAGNEAAKAASAAAELGLSGTVGKEFKAEAEAAFAKADKFRKVTSTAAKTAAVSSIAAARTPVNYVRSGSFSPNAGHLAVQVPYIIMTWPDQSVPEQYGNFVGYPSNIFARLGSLNGYTEVGAIHLDYINCTEHEREELLRILQGGVIL